jgi:GNAT superfamily N-acetyltransferase
METILIRAAVPSEKAEIEALQLRASLTNSRDRDALLANPGAIEVPTEQLAGGRVFLAELNGAFVGFAAVEPRADGETELDGLFVEPEIRRRGIGRLLLEHAAQVARRNGSAALYVVGNPHAQEFYIACGFNSIGTTQTRFGVALLFKKMF